MTYPYDSILDTKTYFVGEKEEKDYNINRFTYNYTLHEKNRVLFRSCCGSG